MILKKMLNKRKTIGIFAALVGVLLSRQSSFFAEGSSGAFFMRTGGVLIACAGLAIYGSGIRGKKEKKIRICPHCYKKTSAEQLLCRSCKKPLEEK